MKNSACKLIFVLLLTSIFIIPIKSSPSFITTNTQINILLIFDNPFGPEYFFTREVLEDRFGWNITTTSLFETINPCSESYPTINVDYTIDELPNIENFDIISIMGGPNQDNLLASQDLLNLIKLAVQKDLVVSAWCRAVRILAAADVINGKEITGHWDYKAEYQAAGAIYYEFVPPIIDGKIVTCVSSTQYRMEMCLALAKAVGVFEDENPELLDYQIIKNNHSNFSFYATAFDNSGIFSVKVEIYNLSSYSERISTYPIISKYLDYLILENQYSTSIELVFGNYTVDFEACDIYNNKVRFLDVEKIQIINNSNYSTNNSNSNFVIIPFFYILLILTVRKIKRITYSFD